MHNVHSNFTRFARLCMAVMSVVLCLSLCNVTPQMSYAATATDLNINARSCDSGAGRGDNIKTLLASVMFSKTTGEATDEITVSLSELARYDGGFGDYGHLKPDSEYNINPNFAGAKLAAYIQTLYQYSWLVPVDKMSTALEHGNFLGAANAGLGAVGTTILSFTMDSAVASTSLFSGAFSLITALSDAVTRVNIPGLLGYVATKTIGGSSDLSADDSIVSNALQFLAGALGVSKVGLEILCTLCVIFISGLLILTTMKALKSRQGVDRQGLSKAKGLALRLAVIVFTVPLGLQLTAVGRAVNKSIMTSANSLGDTLNSTYIIDTLTWAATSNLDLSMISKHGDVLGEAPIDGDKIGTYKAFLPTDKNVGALASAINEKRSKIDSSSDAKSEKGKVKGDKSILKAVDVGEQLRNATSAQAIDIQSYFSALSEASTVGTARMINGVYMSNANPDMAFTVHADGSDDASRAYVNSSSPLYMLASRSSNKNGKKSKTIDSNEKAAIDSREIPLFTTVDDSSVDVTKTKYTHASAMKATQIKLTDPSTYIYGAASAGSLTDELHDYTSFIGDDKSPQSNDPVTGQSKGDDPNFKANAVGIAMLNKYAGVDYSGLGLSTQSTAFLLQSRVDNDTLYYKGYQTAPNVAGSSKNTGINGNKFARYVIPNVGPADLLVKVSQLSLIWTAAAIAAVMALIECLRGPFISSLFKSIKGFLKSLLTGDIFGLGEYVIYYLALALSFSLASFAVLASVWVAVVLSKLPLLGAVVSGLAAESTAIPIVGGIFKALLSIIIAAVLATPVVAVDVKGNGQVRKLSIIGAIVLAPYVVAESLTANFASLRARLYGSSTTGAMARAAADKFNKGRLNPVKEFNDGAKNVAKKVVGAAALGAGALALAPAIAPALAAAKGAMVAAKGAGLASKLMAGARAGGQIATAGFTNAKPAFDALRQGVASGKLKPFGKDGIFNTVQTINKRARFGAWEGEFAQRHGISIDQMLENHAKHGHMIDKELVKQKMSALNNADEAENLTKQTTKAAPKHMAQTPEDVKTAEQVDEKSKAHATDNESKDTARSENTAKHFKSATTPSEQSADTTEGNSHVAKHMKAAEAETQQQVKDRIDGRQGDQATGAAQGDQTKQPTQAEQNEQNRKDARDKNVLHTDQMVVQADQVVQQAVAQQTDQIQNATQTAPNAQILTPDGQPIRSTQDGQTMQPLQNVQQQAQQAQQATNEQRQAQNAQVDAHKSASDLIAEQLTKLNQSTQPQLIGTPPAKPGEAQNVTVTQAAPTSANELHASSVHADKVIVSGNIVSGDSATNDLPQTLPPQPMPAPEVTEPKYSGDIHDLASLLQREHGLSAEEFAAQTGVTPTQPVQSIANANTQPEVVRERIIERGPEQVPQAQSAGQVSQPTVVQQPVQPQQPAQVNERTPEPAPATDQTTGQVNGQVNGQANGQTPGYPMRPADPNSLDAALDRNERTHTNELLSTLIDQLKR